MPAFVDLNAKSGLNNPVANIDDPYDLKPHPLVNDLMLRGPNINTIEKTHLRNIYSSVRI